MLCATKLPLIFDRVLYSVWFKHFLSNKEHYYNRQIVQNTCPKITFMCASKILMILKGWGHVTHNIYLIFIPR